MEKLLKFLKIVDDNLVKFFLTVFIFFIPLWPKLPIKTINYTYIAFRYDDVYVALLVLIFLIQLIRKKITLNKSLIVPFIVFWVIVFISCIWNIYVSKTIVIPHLGFLNSLRRVEYMIVFFVASSVIKSKKDFFQLLGMFLTSVFLVVVYGFGQKFLNFPAVQTMNPEYSKGYLLYLTPDARLSSTFAGHYDLAAYLVFAIPVILSFYFSKNKRNFLFLFIGALLILIYTSSRISFGAYFVATFAFLLFLRKYKFSIFILILTAALMLTTGELTKRFLQTFQVRRIFVNEQTGAVYIGQTITTKDLPSGSYYVKLNNQSTSGAPPVDINIIKNQYLGEKIKEASAEGIVLTDKQKAEIVATISANLTPVNTVVSDISFATRLQIEWPRAIHAVFKNPLLGTGPSSITEATDNDFLRWLGETGLLGTIAFLNVLFLIAYSIWKKVEKAPFEEKVVGLGLIFGLIALLGNATYIDVFEASKVAYTFWTIAGLFIGYYSLSTKNIKS